MTLGNCLRGHMAEIIPFNLAVGPFVRIEPSDSGYIVRFENCPKLRGLDQTFRDGWEALRYGMGFAIGEDIAMLWRPGRVDATKPGSAA